MREIRPTNWLIKICLLTFALLVLAPVVLFPVSMLFGGLFVLGSQVALYRDSGRWYPFSTFELITQTADARVADELHVPVLSSCREPPADTRAGRNQPAPRAARLQANRIEGCPQLGRLRNWLLRPASWTWTQKIAAAILKALPAAVSMIFSGLIILDLLGMLGRKE